MATGFARSRPTRLLNDVYKIRVADLAAGAQVTPATISRWLSGQTHPPLRIRHALARFLDPGQVEIVLAEIEAADVD